MSENRFTGTHTGTLRTATGQEVPATGRRVNEPYVGVFEIDGDRIRKQRVYFDQVALRAALGLM